MSQGNNDNSAGAATGMAAAAVMFIALAFFAVAAFVTFLLTIFALWAWNEPRTIGTFTLKPHEARAFVKRGLAGAFLLPAFLVFVELTLGVQIDWQYINFYMLGGYVGGSFGLEMLMEGETQEVPTTQSTQLQPEILPPTRLPMPLPPPQRAESFRFASWDDEEDGQ